jgi:uncharacterized membrane protein
MLPDPLHPALVHFPIVFTVLLPLVILGALWMARRNPSRRVWAAPVIAAAVLSASAWLAVQTGESQEERVESAVAEAPLEDHEHAASRFLLLSLGVLGVTAVGLAGGAIGKLARGAALAGSPGLAVAGDQVGRSGGELVYEHGAAAAYADAGNTTARAGREREREREDHDED